MPPVTEWTIIDTRGRRPGSQVSQVEYARLNCGTFGRVGAGVPDEHVRARPTSDGHEPGLRTTRCQPAVGGGVP